MGEPRTETQSLRLCFCFSPKHSGILRGPQMEEYVSGKRNNILGLALIKILAVLG